MSWLDKTSGLDGLDGPARQTLSRLEPMDVPAGTVLFEPGDAVQGYVIVLSGKIGVYLVGPTGRDILLYRVEPGDACIQSTLGLLGEEDYSAEAVAETDTQLVLLPRATFLSLTDQSAAFRRAVFAAFAERVQNMMHLMERVAFQSVESRLAAHLLAQADETGLVRATQAEIATAIGTAREVVSRRLDALAKRGVIARERGAVQVLNREWLTASAHESAM